VPRVRALLYAQIGVFEFCAVFLFVFFVKNGEGNDHLKMRVYVDFNCFCGRYKIVFGKEDDEEIVLDMHKCVEMIFCK